MLKLETGKMTLKTNALCYNEQFEWTVKTNVSI